MQEQKQEQQKEQQQQEQQEQQQQHHPRLRHGDAFEPLYTIEQLLAWQRWRLDGEESDAWQWARHVAVDSTVKVRVLSAVPGVAR